MSTPVGTGGKPVMLIQMFAALLLLFARGSSIARRIISMIRSMIPTVQQIQQIQHLFLFRFSSAFRCFFSLRGSASSASFSCTVSPDRRCISRSCITISLCSADSICSRSTTKLLGLSRLDSIAAARIVVACVCCRYVSVAGTWNSCAVCDDRIDSVGSGER